VGETRSGAAAQQGDLGAPRVLVLGKVMAILEAFTTERPELELHEIRAETGLPASTCARLVRNLVADGLLREVGERYRVGLTVVRWSRAALAGIALVDTALPLMERLRDEAGETVGLFVRDGGQRVCIAVTEARHSVARRLGVGHVLPLHVGSPGKVLLAYDAAARSAIEGVELVPFTAATIDDHNELVQELERVRAQGYAVSVGEWEDGVVGVAAPIRDASAEVRAAIAISAPAHRVSGDLERLIPLVTEVAFEISARLGDFAARTDQT
jgi:IclR family acetate operon transcriptional repressor